MKKDLLYVDFNFQKEKIEKMKQELEMYRKTAEEEAASRKSIQDNLTQLQKSYSQLSEEKEWKTLEENRTKESHKSESLERTNLKEKISELEASLSEKEKLVLELGEKSKSLMEVEEKKSKMIEILNDELATEKGKYSKSLDEISTHQNSLRNTEVLLKSLQEKLDAEMKINKETQLRSSLQNETMLPKKMKS